MGRGTSSNPKECCIGQEPYGSYKPLQSQVILQQEVDEDSDAMVVMKDDAELDAYSLSDEQR
jgi:hypothetical protein